MANPKEFIHENNTKKKHVLRFLEKKDWIFEIVTSNGKSEASFPKLHCKTEYDLEIHYDSTLLQKYLSIGKCSH